MARFLPTTIGNLLSPPATRLYPFEKREPFARARGHLEIDIEKCVFCKICAKKCPASAISVDKEKKQWTLTAFQCIICEACVDACPKKALDVKNVYRAPGVLKTVEVYTQGGEREVAETTTRTVGDFRLYRNLYYFPGHTWVKVEGDRVRIGIDDFAAHILQKASAAQLMGPGDIIDPGKTAMTFTMGERTASLAAPLEAKILTRNDAVAKDPSLTAKDPYGEGWIYEAASLNPYEDLKGLHFGFGAEQWLKGDIDLLHQAVEKELGATAADGGTLTDDLGGRLSESAWKEFTKTFFRV